MALDMGAPLFQRSYGRRREDRIVRDLLKVGQVITSEINMDVLFGTIMKETLSIMEAEECIIFVHSRKRNELWPFHSSGLRKNDIPAAAGLGVASWVFAGKSPVIIRDVASDPRYREDIDGIPGSAVTGLLSVPLINRDKQCIGVYHVLKGERQGGPEFTPTDLDLLQALSSFVVIAMENSKLYEELKLLDKTKERVINHIAHEMKTPLAVLSAIVNKIPGKLQEGNLEGLARSFEIGKRNLNRLMQLQEKVDDILNEKAFDEKRLVMNIIEDAFGLVETLKDRHTEHRAILDHVSGYIQSFYGVPEAHPERISLSTFLHLVVDEAMVSAGGRSLEIATDFDEEVSLVMDREILKKTCAGLLKNAIENTPDEGVIEVRSRVAPGGITVEFRDYGVGITEENQRMIFGGFFHTQETSSYSSKEPYAFNAGGSGTDLLRIKAFSERCGFSVMVKSARCMVIPDDSDSCPGVINRCPGGLGRDKCLVSGGSTFTLTFPSASVG